MGTARLPGRGPDETRENAGRSQSRGRGSGGRPKAGEGGEAGALVLPAFLRRCCGLRSNDSIRRGVVAGSSVRPYLPIYSALAAPFRGFSTCLWVFLAPPSISLHPSRLLPRLLTHAWCASSSAELTQEGRSLHQAFSPCRGAQVRSGLPIASFGPFWGVGLREGRQFWDSTLLPGV